MANDPRIEHAKKAATAESNDAGITGARPASPVREPTFEEMGITDSIARSPFPLWLKLLYTAFLVFFVRHFLEHYADYPATEIIWFCYIGLFVLGIAMWTESPLLFSWQTLSLVVPQLIFTFDALFNIFFGPNLDSWTGYMFDPNEHMEHRLLAWFHTPMPFVLLYGVWRLGYDKRALLLQIGASWILWLLAFFFTLPHRNVNLAYGPFKAPQDWVPPWLYLAFIMVAVPQFVYLPTHLLLARFMPAAKRGKPVRRRPDAAVGATPRREQNTQNLQN